MQGYCQDAGIALYDAVTHAINAWVDLGRGLKEKINYRENKQLWYDYTIVIQSIYTGIQ